MINNNLKCTAKSVMRMLEHPNLEIIVGNARAYWGKNLFMGLRQRRVDDMKRVVGG